MSVKLACWMPCSRIERGDADCAPAPVRREGHGERRAMTGNDAVAFALRQVDPHVATAYPITPSSELMHTFAGYVAEGRVATRLIAVESEHSAMSAALGAAAAGSRAFTATAGNGLAHMMEVYHNAGALRLPVVLVLVNRHVGGLLNIHNDHTDAMLCRGASWIQMHAESAQEAYDNALQAFRIAEDPRIRLPVTVCHDGFIVSHTLERLLTLPDAEARAFVGDLVSAVDLLDVDNPRAVGPFVLPDHAASFQAQVAEAMRWAPEVIEGIGREFEQVSGRPGGLIDAYRMEDAEVAVVAMGSICGTVRTVVDLLRSEGVRAGLLKLRVFRPFPVAAIAPALARPSLKAVAVLDKSTELGSGGPLFTETVAALAVHARAEGAAMPVVCNPIMGIGGRDVTLADVNGLYTRLLELARDGQQPADPVRFVDVGDEGEHVIELTRASLGRDIVRSSCNIVMLARGGQGARTACYLLAELMIDRGKYAHGFPAYGPERTGAPVRAFAKISDRPLEDRQQIYSADVLAIFDETLISSAEQDIANLAPEGLLLVNTQRGPAEVRRGLGMEGRRIVTVDASGVAAAELGLDRPNTAMVAAMVAALGLCDMQGLKDAIRRMNKLSGDLLQGNLRAIDRTVWELCEEEAG